MTLQKEWGLFQLKKYSENDLLPKITNEVTLQHNGINPRKSLWQTLYDNNPNNYWCKVFVDKIRSSSHEEINSMIHYGVRLENVLVKVVGNTDSVSAEDEHEILTCIVRHLEFFHKMDEHFFDTVIELCERAEEFSKQIPWLDTLILSDPGFLSKNPLVGMLSKRYNATMYRLLLSNKEIILNGGYSVLR